MTVDQFVSNNRGINAGENVPRQLLEGLYYTIKRKEIKMSGDGLTGEVNDALWADLLMMSKKATEQRPYIRMDRLRDSLPAYVDPFPPTPQHINGHVIGLTIFRPPIQPLPTPGNGHLPEASPVHPSRQVTLSELSRSASEGPSGSGAPSIFTVTAPDGLVARGCWMEEDMFMEGWNAAIAALSMVFDLLQVDRDGHGVVVGSVDGGDDDEGWNKVEKERGTELKAHTDPAADAQDDDVNEGDLLAYLHNGFNLLSAVAASYSKHHVIDKVISALCKFTGLVSDYRGDSTAAAVTSSPSVPGRSPTHAQQQRATPTSSVLRFAAQAKAQWALSLTFALVHTHYDIIREGWRDIVVCVLQVYAMGLLPSSMLTLDDHVGWLEVEGERKKGRSRLLTHLAPQSVSEERATSVSALFSSVSSYFMYGMTGSTPLSPSEERESRGSEVEAAEKLCSDCIERCQIPSLLSDSKLMHIDALMHLIAALMELVPVQRVNGLSGVKAGRKWTGLTAGKGAARVVVGQEEGDGFDLSITDEDPDMVADVVYAHESDKEKTGEQFPFSNPCTLCECHCLCSPDSPVEVRRLLLCHQLLCELSAHNRDRVEAIWPALRSYFLSIITSTQSTGAGLPLALIGRSNSNPVLTSIREGGGEGDSRSVTPGPTNLHSPTHRTQHSTPPSAVSVHSSGQQGSVAPAALLLPPFVVESAVSCFFSLSARLLAKEWTGADLLSTITTLSTVSLLHTGPATQLMAGLLSILRADPVHLQSNHVTSLLSLIASASLYRPTYMLGFRCLSHFLLTQRCGLIALPSFAPAVQAVLAYAQSRWCSPTLSLTACDMLLQLYERSKLLVQVEREQSHQHSNGDAYMTPTKHLTRGQAAAPSPTASSSPSPSSASSHAASTPLRHLHHLWQQLCSPLLSAYRTLITSSTTRIRLLHNAHLRVSRSGGPGTRAAHAAQPSSGAPSPAPAPTPASHPYRGYIGYVQGYGEVRRRAITQLRQILILEDFSVRISECVAHLSLQAEPQPRPSPRAGRGDVGSPVLSLTSTTFWQLCLDEILFPSLLSLSPAQAIDLELTDDLTTARSTCLVLLEKVFLLHLPQLLSLEGAGGGRGFNGAWLHVLKLMDNFMQLGIRRERLMLERKKKSVYDRKRERRRSELGDSSAPAADDFDGVDSGVLLTESVEEALKNCILVMKASNVFGVKVETPQRGKAAQAAVVNEELWDLTWAVVDPVLPHLKPQLFPELARLMPQPPTTPPQTAVTAAAPAGTGEEPSLSHTEVPLSTSLVMEAAGDGGASKVAEGAAGQQESVLAAAAAATSQPSKGEEESQALPPASSRTVSV